MEKADIVKIWSEGGSQEGGLVWVIEIARGLTKRTLPTALEYNKMRKPSIRFCSRATS